MSKLGALLLFSGLVLVISLWSWTGGVQGVSAEIDLSGDIVNGHVGPGTEINITGHVHENGSSLTGASLELNIVDVYGSSLKVPVTTNGTGDFVETHTFEKEDFRGSYSLVLNDPVHGGGPLGGGTSPTYHINHTTISFIGIVFDRSNYLEGEQVRFRVVNDQNLTGSLFTDYTLALWRNGQDTGLSDTYTETDPSVLDFALGPGRYSVNVSDTDTGYSMDGYFYVSEAEPLSGEWAAMPGGPINISFICAPDHDYDVALHYASMTLMVEEQMTTDDQGYLHFGYELPGSIGSGKYHFVVSDGPRTILRRTLSISNLWVEIEVREMKTEWIVLDYLVHGTADLTDVLFAFHHFEEVVEDGIRRKPQETIEFETSGDPSGTLTVTVPPEALIGRYEYYEGDTLVEGNYSYYVEAVASSGMDEGLPCIMSLPRPFLELEVEADPFVATGGNIEVTGRAYGTGVAGYWIAASEGIDQILPSVEPAGYDFMGEPIYVGNDPIIGAEPFFTLMPMEAPAPGTNVDIVLYEVTDGGTRDAEAARLDEVVTDETGMLSVIIDHGIDGYYIVSMETVLALSNAALVEVGPNAAIMIDTRDVYTVGDIEIPITTKGNFATVLYYQLTLMQRSDCLPAGEDGGSSTPSPTVLEQGSVDLGTGTVTLSFDLGVPGSYSLEVWSYSRGRAVVKGCQFVVLMENLVLLTEGAIADGGKPGFIVDSSDLDNLTWTAAAEGFGASGDVATDGTFTFDLPADLTGALEIKGYRDGILISKGSFGQPAIELKVVHLGGEPSEIWYEATLDGIGVPVTGVSGATVLTTIEVADDNGTVVFSGEREDDWDHTFTVGNLSEGTYSVALTFTLSYDLGSQGHLYETSFTIESDDPVVKPPVVTEEEGAFNKGSEKAAVGLLAALVVLLILLFFHYRSRSIKLQDDVYDLQDQLKRKGIKQQEYEKELEKHRRKVPPVPKDIPKEPPAKKDVPKHHLMDHLPHIRKKERKQTEREKIISPEDREKAAIVPEIEADGDFEIDDFDELEMETDDHYAAAESEVVSDTSGETVTAPCPTCGSPMDIPPKRPVYMKCGSCHFEFIVE